MEVYIMAEQLVLLVKEHDLDGNAIITQFTNPRVGDLERLNKHNLRVAGKPIDVIEYSSINA